MKRPKVICDHAGMKRCIKACLHAHEHYAKEHLTMRCTDPGECGMNPKYKFNLTYLHVCCRPAKEAKP